MQCIVVKSGEFEIHTPFYMFFLNSVYVAARLLRSLRSNYFNRKSSSSLWSQVTKFRLKNMRACPLWTTGHSAEMSVEAIIK